jgi:hypothetical protein
MCDRASALDALERQEVVFVRIAALWRFAHIAVGLEAVAGSVSQLYSDGPSMMRTWQYSVARSHRSSPQLSRPLGQALAESAPTNVHT